MTFLAKWEINHSRVISEKFEKGVRCPHDVSDEWIKWQERFSDLERV